MNPRRLIPLLLVPALGGMYYTLQRMGAPAAAPAAAPAGLPLYTLDQAELTRYGADGAPTLRGIAQRIDYFPDQSAQAYDLQVDLLAAEGAPWRLSAPAALLPAQARRFELSGPVLAQGRWPDDGSALQVRTEQLWIDPDLHEIATDAPVDLAGDTRQGRALGLRADWSARNLWLLHDVQMQYEAPH
jgi:LPS export ABC transporter protein LptC